MNTIDLIAAGVEPDHTPVDTFMNNPGFGFALCPDDEEPELNEDETCTDY